MARFPRRRSSARRCNGFTILELSVALVIIAIIIGAITTGADVMRVATGQKIFSEFITGWSSSFTRYTTATNVVPGDDPVSPTYTIRAPNGGALLCNNDAGPPDLTNTFLAKGIELPAGWTQGREDRYAYQDSSGTPHLLQVCLLTLPSWSVPGLSSGVYVPSPRHVMRLTGLTTELAMQLDTLVDGRLDQRFGKFRSVAQASSLSNTGADWPAVRTAPGEDAVQEIDAYLLLN